VANFIVKTYSKTLKQKFYLLLEYQNFLIILTIVLIMM